MRTWNRPTDVVMPFEDGEATSEASTEELDWCFEDPELTMQLRAVNEGRGWMVMTVVSSLVAVCAGIALVL
jgi:hypothetical protein